MILGNVITKTSGAIPKTQPDASGNSDQNITHEHQQCFVRKTNEKTDLVSAFRVKPDQLIDRTEMLSLFDRSIGDISPHNTDSKQEKDKSKVEPQSLMQDRSIQQVKKFKKDNPELIMAGVTYVFDRAYDDLSGYSFRWQNEELCGLRSH